MSGLAEAIARDRELEQIGVTTQPVALVLGSASVRVGWRPEQFGEQWAKGQQVGVQV